jgi:hypothetical protein
LQFFRRLHLGSRDRMQATPFVAAFKGLTASLFKIQARLCRYGAQGDQTSL